MQKEDFERMATVIAAYSSIDKVFGSGVLDAPRHPLFEAGFICVAIHLNDLLQKAAKDGQRVTFDDDIGFVFGSPRDVTTLIADARNAACHVGSPKQDINSARLRLNVIAGYSPNAMLIDGVAYGCDYEDDVAVQFGPMRIYLRRHVGRALIEVQKAIPRDQFRHQTKRV